MSGAPLLLNSNLFSVLEVYEPEVSEDGQNTQKLLPPVTDSHKLRRLKWERQMACRLVIHSLEQDPKCIMVLIHLKTTDTMEEASTEAMADTGTTGDFVDQDFVNQAKLPI